MTDSTDAVGAAKARLQRALRGRADEEAACVTLVAGRTVAEVLDAFGADPAEPPVPPAEVPFGIPAVAVAEVPGGVLAIEDNGFQGSARIVLRLASAGGRAASMFWNVNADMSLDFARDGVVSGPGDGILHGELGDDPEELALFDGLGDPRDPDSWLPDVEVRGVLAAERFTGVRVDAPPAPPPGAVHVVLARLEDHFPRSRAAAELLRIDGADELHEAVLAATPEKLRHLAAWAARTLLVGAGAAEHPALARTMATLERPAGPVLGPDADLLIRRSLQRPWGESIPEAALALRVLYHAANPDPFSAAAEALRYANWALKGAEAEEFLAAALREVRGLR